MAIVLCLLVLIFFFVDIKRSIELLFQIELAWVAAAIVVVQIQMILSAVRWRVTMARLGQIIGLRHAVSEYYLATFANMTIPGGITGDAARAYRIRRTVGLGVAVHGVVLERMAGQVALLLVAVAGWLFWPILMQGSVPEFGARVLGSTVLVVAGGLVMVFLLVKLAPEFITRFIVDLGPSLYRAWWSDRQWIVQSVLSLSIVFTYLLVFLISSYAIREPLPIVAVITIVPVVLLSMVIPITIGGWGIREAAAATLWPLAGLSSEAGVATSIVYALISLLGCLPGLFAMLARRFLDH